MFEWLKKRKNQDIKAAPEISEEKRREEAEWQAFIKDTTPSENITIIERKIVVDDYSVSKNHKKMVMYLEDSRNEMVNAFIGKNHHVISEIFKQWGYTFMYAPKEMEAIANHYGSSMLDVEWNASKLLEMQGCQLDEPIGTALVEIDGVEWDDEQDCWVATMKGVQLDAENKHDLTEQIRGYWGILNKKYQAEKEERSCIRYRTADEKRKCCKVQESRVDYERRGEMFDRASMLFLDEEPEPETLTKEDEQLLSEILERVEKLRHTGIRQYLIEQMVRMTVKPSMLQVTNDARLLLTDYGKEVVMLPIDKVVYIFYLRHPEGVAIKLLEEHKEELTDIYSRILGNKRLTTKQRKSIERLCDPLDNSINEKISRIRQAFQAVAHDSVANCYIIRGERGEKRSISLNEELIELGEWGRR